MITQANEIDPLKLETKRKVTKPVSYLQLYRFANQMDYVWIVISIIGAICNGLSMPIYSIIFGNLTDSFAYEDAETKLNKAGLNTIYMFVLGICTLLVTLIMYTTFSITSENQTKRLRRQYLKSLLTKQVKWYDEINANSLNTKVNSEILAISDAIGDKVITFGFSIATFLSGFLVGYIKGWKLALVITSALPVLAITIALIGISASWREQFIQKSDIESSSLVEEVLSSIKTVKTLDGEEFESEKFRRVILHSSKSIIKYGLYYGLAFGSMCGVQQFTYALGIFYSGVLIAPDYSGPIYTSGSICTIFISVLMGSLSLGKIGPCLSCFAKGKLAAMEVFQVIDESQEQEVKNNQVSFENLDGDIKLQNIQFSYPSKPDHVVLKNISFVIPQGKKIALVGESGSGKSTIGQLLLKFYEIENGQILIGADQIPLSQIDTHQFRQQISIVSQEPALFNTTIRENLKLGNQRATDEELITMLNLMNSSELVDHLDTNVGFNGNQFSGGQKQRIALARALLQNPKILILDEATSALDRTNESLITRIIDEKFNKTTRIVIAHRLSTVQDSDNIIVFNQGEIIGQGTHNELLQNCEHYSYLISKQQQKEETGFGTLTFLDMETQRKIPGGSLSKIISQENNQFEKSKVQVINTQVDVKQQLDKECNEEVKVEAAENGSELSFWKSIKSLIMLNYKELPYLIIGSIAALGNGSIYPIFSQILADVIDNLLIHNPQRVNSIKDENERQQFIIALDDTIKNSATTLLILGFIYFVTSTLECFCFSVYSERLTIRMKNEIYQKFLRLPISFYDNPNHNIGFLTPKVTNDTRVVQQFFQNIIGFKCQYYSAIIVGFALSFVSSWKLTLLAVGLAPISYIGGCLSESNHLPKRHISNSNKLLMDTLTNIRTVYSLRAETFIVNQYANQLEGPPKQVKKFGAQVGFSSGYAQMKPFFVNGYLFLMGTLLNIYDDLPILAIYQTILAIIFSVVGGAKTIYFQSDNNKTKNSIAYYFSLLETEDEYQREQKFQHPRIKRNILGNIEFKNVIFSYPQRPNIIVLKNLSIKIDAGHNVGLVGCSGCGKSTIFQLLFRLYDVNSGEITVDGVSIYDYDLRFLRQQISIVSQEPQLFNESIAYNIKYNQTNATEEDIIQKSKLSHAYEFIMDEQSEDQTNSGFNKKVGTKGSLISGGQKQRIAISRALLRNSKIYLFDESTSALDSNVESLVQQQLEECLKEKTSIVIAHRMSTIKNCKIIYVFDKGQIIEQGNYGHLVNLKGHFYKLEQGLLNQNQEEPITSHQVLN
ncbi:unnamed protein product (macronuclear) [Paramecium tetraurelia]|uniref:Uncharacterized protein n=1 Tax=Paramecium tetraurelia TaxID=5888 RepID=A0CH03_PARTE|nr:uncharacterized protein GSPATT00007510001 [Paramecium tetraurelia]CAK70070.1 unnamed protein product [Paramecium tetraurelia]|eukprot:XP_001437467.1 hypothetical protein (macronuclear) [Paramecium tetraurelia strain d4-2]